MRQQPGAQVVTAKSADHENIAMCEVDKAQNTVNHRVTQRDQRIERAQREPVNQLLEKFGACHPERFAE